MKSNRFIAVFLLFLVTFFLSIEFFGIHALAELIYKESFVKQLSFNLLYVQKWVVMLIFIVPFAIFSDIIKKRLEMIVFGIILIIFGYILFLIYGTEFNFFILFGIGTAFIITNLPALIASLFDKKEERRNAAFILFFIGLSFGIYTVPFAISKLLDNSTHQSAIVLFIVILTISLILLLFGRNVINSNNKDLLVETKSNKNLSTILSLFVLFTSSLLFIRVISNLVEKELSSYAEFTLGQASFDPQIFLGFTGSFIFFFLFTLFFVYIIKKNSFKTIYFITLSFVFIGIGTIVIYPIAFDLEFTKTNFFFMFLGNMFFFALAESFMIPFGLSIISRISNPKWLSTVFSFLFILYFSTYPLDAYIGSLSDRSISLLIFINSLVFGGILYFNRNKYFKLTDGIE